MEPLILVEFGMERAHKLVALACGYDIAIDGGKHIHTLRHTDDIWCPYECHRHVLTYVLHRSDCVEASQLPAIGIALDHNVHSGYALTLFAFHTASQQNHSSACAEDRQSALYG